MTYNSRLAQELAKWAETQDGGAAIHDALYRAYFVDGLNIALIENLMAVVRLLGLPEDEARDVLVSRQFRAAVDADWERCRDLGITALPTFVVGNDAVVGGTALRRAGIAGGEGRGCETVSHTRQRGQVNLERMRLWPTSW